MKKINLEKKDMHRGNLIVVNLKYPMYIKSNKAFEEICNPFEKFLIDKEVKEKLLTIFEKIKSDGQILVESGYRDKEGQRKIYQDITKEKGIEYAEKYVAIPGHSEHHTGLAIDLALFKEGDDPYGEFRYTGICEKFRKRALDYGFIQRYKKDKEQITGISEEPWHFRYVGYPHSAIMDKENLCLEEYIEYLKNKGSITYKNIEILYVSYKEDGMEVELPCKCDYEVSGDNVGGFVFTIHKHLATPENTPFWSSQSKN
ncbi:MAG: D-alanyl-D-alanine carboxypeptidase family protein [Lachnospirales bacterium]